MKRVLSTGDINAAAIGNNDDHCDDDNGVLTQVRSRRNKKNRRKLALTLGRLNSLRQFLVAYLTRRSLFKRQMILLLRWLQILTVTLQIKMRLTYR